MTEQLLQVSFLVIATLVCLPLVLDYGIILQDILADDTEDLSVRRQPLVREPFSEAVPHATLISSKS